MPFLRFKLTIAFDGSGYHGWQRQNTGRGVQNFVEKSLARIFPSLPQVQGSSRTDSGVHALGLVAHFEIPIEEFHMREEQLVVAVNSGLPDDIRVMAAVFAPPDFDARFGAIGKEYHYHVWNRPVMNPLLRGTHWHVSKILDVSSMRKAASDFVGRHDFRSFTAARDGELGDPYRTIARCEIRQSESRLTFVIEGSGFLYKMCRGIVGTLVQIGEGKSPADAVKGMLDQGDRTAAGMSAPAHGLVLQAVFYREA